MTDGTRSLEVVKSDISKSTIVGTSCAILILLFLIQPLGTSRIGSAFAPIVIIWMMFNLSFGIYVSFIATGKALHCSLSIEPRPF